MDESRYETGMRIRREVHGDAWVNQAEAHQTTFDADFQRFIIEVAWGTLWARPNLDRRTRSVLTIAILAALGRTEELELHIRSSQNTGVTADEIAETLLHVAVYAGIPAANAAFAVGKRVLTATSNEASDRQTD